MKSVPKPTLSVSRDGPNVVVHASGELDFAVTQDLLESVEAAAADSSACLLDCEEVTFVDSEVVKTIFELHRRFVTAGKLFYLRNPSAQVVRILALLGLQDHIPRVRS